MKILNFTKPSNIRKCVWASHRKTQTNEIVSNHPYARLFVLIKKSLITSGKHNSSWMGKYWCFECRIYRAMGFCETFCCWLKTHCWEWGLCNDKWHDDHWLRCNILNHNINRNFMELEWKFNKFSFTIFYFWFMLKKRDVIYDRFIRNLKDLGNFPNP